MALMFFDIDGTLWDRKNVIPESTKKALRLLKQNGHQIFLCSGRTRVFIRDEELLAQGFDGILSGCGTCIDYEGEEIFYKKLDPELMERSVEAFYEADIPALMEGRDWLYMDEDLISRDEYGKYLMQTMKEHIQPIRGNQKNWEASKFSLVIRNRDYETVMKKLQDDFDFLVHWTVVMEAVPKGCSKATAIAAVCEKLGADRRGTFAFGDSANDLAMLDFAGTGIVMGNGSDIAKAHADYITDDIHADGIYRACRHFGLI